MPLVKSEAVIEAPLQELWELAQGVEKMPEFMPDLVAVKILEDEQLSPTKRRTVSDWTARIKQFNRNVHWVEEDIWDTETYACTFEQTKGDYNVYRGEWKFVPVEGTGHTQALLEIEYAIEIPLLGALIQKVVKKLMQENCDMMLRCLKAEAEKEVGGGR